MFSAIKPVIICNICNFSGIRIQISNDKNHFLKFTFRLNFLELPELPEFRNWNSDLGQGNRNSENRNPQPRWDMN